MSDYMYRVSEALSEVMDDIGVNEIFQMKRRRTFLLMEKLWNISPEYKYVKKANLYHFGSQSEGSTTWGLKSDVDRLLSKLDCIVIQDWNEWKHGVTHYKIIQNEDISPGYCHLQYVRHYKPLPVTLMEGDLLMYYITDSKGGLLWKNDSRSTLSVTDPRVLKHGPAFTDPGLPGMAPTDTVYAFYCTSSPYQASTWLQKHRHSNWPSDDVFKDCRNAGCFVVPVGSKVHSPDILESELEWRISTSLQERYLMFSLNIPQLMCYVLMKMILKTHINPYVTDVLSSFMCKNVLLYCIANSTHDWHKGNLLAYLHLCLFMLKECIEQRNCPHFLIPENNLLAGHMTDVQRDKLLDMVNTLMRIDEQLLFEIEIDDLGKRLKMKLNMIPYCPDIRSAEEISWDISTFLVHSIAGSQCMYFSQVLNEIQHGSKEKTHQFLSETCLTLERYSNEGDLQHTASDLLIPFMHSTLGSVMASNDIESHTAISDQAFTYLEAGKESDALSGRLKLLSVLYCTGDMERAVRELTIIKTHYNIAETHTVCTCYSKGRSKQKAGGRNNFEHYNEKAIKSNIAFCTRYLQCEINCVPCELRYEILRSYIEEDRQMRKKKDSMWMDLIVVDSIPYLYFLLYKIYGQLQRRQERLQYLTILNKVIVIELNLQHKDTALNLLGQCCEQENMHREAIQCYIASLKHRPRNHAARFLLCIQLCKLWKQDHTQ